MDAYEQGKKQHRWKAHQSKMLFHADLKSRRETVTNEYKEIQRLENFTVELKRTNVWMVFLAHFMSQSDYKVQSNLRQHVCSQHQSARIKFEQANAKPFKQ